MEFEPLMEEDLTKMSKAEQNKYASEFCEGDEKLKDLLLFLWAKGINTNACCKGHIADRGRGAADISFECQNMSDDSLVQMCQNIINSKLENKFIWLDFINKLEEKSTVFHYAGQMDFSILKDCIDDALNGKSKPSQLDEEFKFVSRLMKLNLKNQDTADAMECISEIKTTLFPANMNMSGIKACPTAFFSDNFEEELKKSKYKAFLYDFQLYDYIIGSEVKSTIDAESYNEFKSLNLSEEQIKIGYYSLTEEGVRNLEKQLKKTR